MVTIGSNKNNHNYDVFYITVDDKTFVISFEGNLDLYWSYQYEGNILEVHNSVEFMIKHEDKILYDMFDRLFKSIKKGDPFEDDSNNITWKKQDKYALFKNNKIEFHSDEGEYDNVSYFTIERFKNNYKLTFYKGEMMNHYLTYSTRISTSGSRYSFFYVPFIIMYNELKEYDKLSLNKKERKKVRLK